MAHWHEVCIFLSARGQHQAFAQIEMQPRTAITYLLLNYPQIAMSENVTAQYRRGNVESKKMKMTHTRFYVLIDCLRSTLSLKPLATFPSKTPDFCVLAQWHMHISIASTVNTSAYVHVFVLLAKNSHRMSMCMWQGLQTLTCWWNCKGCEHIEWIWNAIQTVKTPGRKVNGYNGNSLNKLVVH